MFLRILLLTAGLLLPVLAQAEPGVNAGANQLQSQSIEELAASIEHRHAVAALVLAKDLWEAGRKDDAVFFFYLGQLRFRAHLLANPNADPSGERALYDALMSQMGPPINQYAFGDIPALLASTASSPGTTAMPTTTRRRRRARRSRPD